MGASSSLSKDLSTFSKHLSDFIITLTYSFAELIHETQGEAGLKTMSVTVGSRLWDEFSECFEHSMPLLGSDDEKVAFLLANLKESGIIGDYSTRRADRMIEVMINDCCFIEASERQMECGISPPLCLIGGLIVAGLHEKAHILTTLEDINHDLGTSATKLTFRIHP